MLNQVKSYIDNNLNPAKVNVIYPTKHNFTQLLCVQEILDELEIAKVDYYRALSISKDEDLELHSKMLMLVRKLGRQIWPYNLFLMSTRQ